MSRHPEPPTPPPSDITESPANLAGRQERQPSPADISRLIDTRRWAIEQSFKIQDPIVEAGPEAGSVGYTTAARTVADIIADADKIAAFVLNGEPKPEDV